jgi:hypothetical protein
MYRQDHSEMRWGTNGDVIERLTVPLIFAILIVYVAARAALMSITHDEALTYAWHVKGSVTDIVSFSTPGLPDNNHMLFTLLAKASTIAFGPSEFALRLPSVVAYAGFLAALYLTLRLFVQGVVLWLFFLFVALNPYVVDMFSIARGYGLGMGLATAGLYLVLSATTEGKEGSVWKPVLAGALFALAAFAHFAMLLLFIAFLGLRVLAAAGAFMRGVFRRRRAALEAIGLASVAGLLAAASIKPLLKISHADLLTPLPLFSGKSKAAITYNELQRPSFFNGTVDTLVAGSLRNVDPPAVVGVILCAVVAVALILLAVKARSLVQHRRLLGLATVTGLLVAVCVGTILQHDLFGVAYLAERRAVFLIPLFGIMCALLFAGRNYISSPSARALIAVAALSPLILLPKLAVGAGFRMTWDWAYDADTETMIRQLETLPHEHAPYAIGINWLFEPSINYYRHVDKLDWLQKATRDGAAGRYDFYYVFGEDFGSLEKAVGPLEVIALYPTTVLARPRDQLTQPTLPRQPPPTE